MPHSDDLPELPPIDLGIYRHAKTGDLYELLGVSLHTETLEPLVVYRGLYDHPRLGPNPLWVRPYAMFVDKITYNGEVRSRFEYLGKSLDDL